jgi:hypothetical protein
LACFFSLLQQIWETCFAVGFFSRAGQLKKGVVNASIGGGVEEGVKKGAEEVVKRVGAINTGVKI